MSASPLPETSQRPDWPRLVARKVNNHEGRITALEVGGGGISRAKLRFLGG